MPGLEPGLLDSKSKVIAITLQNQTNLNKHPRRDSNPQSQDS